MNTAFKTLFAAACAIALIGTTLAVTATSAEAGPRRGFQGITNTTIGSGR